MIKIFPVINSYLIATFTPAFDTKTKAFYCSFFKTQFDFFILRLSSKLFNCFSQQLLFVISCSKRLLLSYTLKYVLFASIAKEVVYRPWELIKVLRRFAPETIVMPIIQKPPQMLICFICGDMPLFENIGPQTKMVIFLKFC